jgi:hypothetical protein
MNPWASRYAAVNELCLRFAYWQLNRCSTEWLLGYLSDRAANCQTL